MAMVPSDPQTVAGEPLAYPSTPDPVISSKVMTILLETVTEARTYADAKSGSGSNAISRVTNA